MDIPCEISTFSSSLAWGGLVAGWIGLNVATSWYQGLQNDWTYGKQRHFEIDAVVGHNDSPAHPSHFTAENDNGQIIVIELPGGDVSKAKFIRLKPSQATLATHL